MRIIKYYKNRKIYDTVERRYTTHIDLIKLIKKGEIIKIINYDTQEDVTEVNLIEALKNIHITSSQLIEILANNPFKYGDLDE